MEAIQVKKLIEVLNYSTPTKIEYIIYNIFNLLETK
jgi:hypothetical protein